MYELFQSCMQSLSNSFISLLEPACQLSLCITMKLGQNSDDDVYILSSMHINLVKYKNTKKKKKDVIKMSYNWIQNGLSSEQHFQACVHTP